jgi:hypothetical protein
MDDTEETDMSLLTTGLSFALQARRLRTRTVHAVAIIPDHDRHHFSRLQRALHPLQRCCGLSDIA